MGFRAFFAIPAAGGMFFFCAWILMVFVGILANDFGVRTIGYITSMLTTIAIWLVVAPLVGVVARSR